MTVDVPSVDVPAAGLASAAGTEEEITLFRASFAQQRMWFLSKLDPGNPLYNVPIILQFDGAVRPDALQRALAEIVSRHEILRTTFVEFEGELMQAVAQSAAIPVPVTEIEPTPGQPQAPTRRADVRAAVRDLVTAPFDLSAGPLLRAHLLDLRDGVSLFVATMHHIIVDGWSIGVLCEELRALYQAEVTGVAAALPPVRLHMGDIAEDERERASGPAYARHREYWKAQLAGELTAPELPFDRDRPSHSTSRGASLDFTVSSAQMAAMAALGRDMDVTAFMTLLAVFYTLLYRYNGSHDQVVGAPMANREDSRTAGLIGLFVNTIPLRARIDPDAGFAELLASVREVTLGAYEHQELPLEQIVEEVAPERLPGRNPLVAVLFAMQSPPPANLDFAGSSASFVGMPTEATRADLELHFWPRKDHIAAQFVYSTELFDAATVEHIRDDYLALLDAAIASPHVPIRSLPMGTEEAPVVQNLAPLLEHAGSSVAVTGGGGEITHAELRETAAALAEALPEARGGVVALALERGPDLVAALVAAVSVGAQRVVWLPPSHPAPYRERALCEWAPSVVVDEVRVAGARAAGTSAPLTANAAAGQLDSGLAEMLAALLHSGRVHLDRPEPVARTVLTADRRFAPPGVLGELCVGPLDTGVLPTGVPARVRRDSCVEIARAPRGIAWDGYRWADLSTVEAVLLNNPLIDDCAVLSRRTDSGATELVAYVATCAPVSAHRLSELARAALPAPLTPRAFVLVAALPVTSTGALDIAALRRLPVIDDELIAQWSAQLPEATRVQAVPDIAEPPRIRVLGPPAHGAPELAAHAAEPTRDELSVLDGGPAVDPTVLSLPDALVRAAHETATTELVFLDESGAERRLTYAALLDAARRVLGGLRASGLVPGDLAIVHLPRNDDFTAAIWGCFLGGFVPVPVAANSAGGADKTAEAWNTLGQPLVIGEFAHPAARTALIGDLLAHEPDAEHHRPDPDALALLLLTSGSTGTPKGVQLTHRNILTRSAATAQMNGFGSADISFNWMPLEHVGGIVMSHLHDVYVCCQQVHAATSWVLADPLRWLAVADRYRVSTTWAPNFAFGLIADRLAETAEPERFDLSPLRFILNGGEAIVPRTARRFLRMMEQFGLPRTAMRPSWGMSETSSGVLYSETFSLETTTDADQCTELAKPLPGTRMRIVDADDKVVPVGAVGRVQISGPTVTRGYYADAERTAEAFTADGWFDTGDLGRIQHGALALTGRAKDVIIVHGVNYTCHEIESAVEESPFVMRSYSAAVAVRPEGSDTDALAIVFSPQPEAAEDEAFADIRARVLAVGPNPDFLIPVAPENIPKTDIGKIQRTLLRERFAAGEFDHAIRGQGAGASAANTLPNWFFQPVWHRRERARRSAVVEGGVLITGEPGALGAQLAEQLGARGVPVARADAKDVAAGLGSCAGQTAIRAVVCCIAEQPGHANPDSSQEALPASVFEVARILRGLAGESQPPALYVVGCGTQAVTDTDAVESGLATIPALLRSAVAETPGLRVRFIDLDPDDPGAGAHHVAGELGETAHDGEIAYRGGVRWVKGLERLPDEPGAPADIAPGTLHLISGGLGGLAYELARLLVERFHARVLLIGRRDPAPGQLAAHRRLSEAAGHEAVRYHVADVCDVGQVWNAVTESEHDWGAQLSGVWHLAGAYREQPMATTTEAELADVAKAKVAGVRALHQIALRRPGVRFVSFSSVNGFFGGAGVGGYSAANAYLDAFTLYQRRNCGIAAQSIAWTMWDHIGMSAHVEHPELTRARGYHVLSRSDGLNSLLIALAHDAPHILVGLNDAKPMVRARLAGLAPTKHLLVADLPQAAPERAGVLVHDRYGCVVPTRVESPNAAREWVAARDDTERRLSAIWQQVLGSDNFGVTDSFFEIGGNSVLLALAHRLVQEAFERSIALVDLFRYPTVSTLAAYLSGTSTAPDPGDPKSDFGSDRARIRKEARRRTRPSRA
ncbi:condensation domain protein [Segniliparus rotundus DSM 44985]|uniref:Condensation domain protein n=1 Tax=Segniliparus rotundus (strain ATCC BAA-972 / CDC 1076 / CIP 108378 / DSM 44985 / JCM 13578) TaxID=640132 RepID=D6ZBC6_SEGRD|nr:SDR family NAD(P)-dependent oxidoreductase [Segniliparus rotundus]ADG98878.1 condensation domain protein [Segniliparus rotundus DSM 44985]